MFIPILERAWLQCEAKLTVVLGEQLTTTSKWAYVSGLSLTISWELNWRETSSIKVYLLSDINIRNPATQQQETTCLQHSFTTVSCCVDFSSVGYYVTLFVHCFPYFTISCLHIIDIMDGGVTVVTNPIVNVNVTSTISTFEVKCRFNRGISIAELKVRFGLPYIIPHTPQNMHKLPLLYPTCTMHVKLRLSFNFCLHVFRNLQISQS